MRLGFVHFFPIQVFGPICQNGQAWRAHQAPHQSISLVLWGAVFGMSDLFSPTEKFSRVEIVRYQGCYFSRVSYYKSHLFRAENFKFPKKKW